MKAWMSSNFGRKPLLTSELAALERLKKRHIIMLASSFLIGSSSLLQVWGTTMISRMSLKFGRIRPRTAKLAALERLNKTPIDL